jgi:DNA/RNA-binding domain of Phe-tRNA-synthetase-like protein
MHFTVEPSIFDLFPGMRLAIAIANEIDNAVNAAIATEWQHAWKQAAAEALPYGNAQSHPRVKIWREAYRSLGVSGKEFPSSIEALLRRPMKGGEPFSINPLVDWYNTISLRHTVPAGGFDLDDIHGTLELRLTCEEDTFLSMDAAEPVSVPPGEVAYVSDSTVLTRHFVWRQSREGLITPATRSVFLVSEVLEGAGDDVAETVLDDFSTGLVTHFGVTGHAFLVDARVPEISW